MANNKIENITYENVITAGTANSLMIQYERGKAAPMDITDVFATLNGAKNYAMNGNNAYVGKTLSVIENNKVDVYKINYNNSIDKLVDENDIENLKGSTVSADTRLTLLEADQHKHDNMAILSNITESKVSAWDNAEQNAKDYASGLSVNYDVAGAAASALTEAKKYVDIISADTRLTSLEAINHNELIISAVSIVVSGAPEAFDTLKEIADWIAEGSGTTAANIVADIKNLKGSIVSADSRLLLLEADQHKHNNMVILNGITESKVSAWDDAEQNAKDYASGLSVNYDVAGAAASALTEAKDYVDSNLNNVRLHIGLNASGVSILSGKTLVKIIQELQSKENDNVFDSLTITGDGSNALHINADSDGAYIYSDDGSINISNATTFENGFDANGDVYINGSFYLFDYSDGTAYRLYSEGGTLYFNDNEVGSGSGGVDPLINSSTAQTVYLMGKTESSSQNLSTASLYVSKKVYSDGLNIYATSDETLKDIVKNIDCDLDVLAKLPKFNFTWKNDSEKKLDIGTSAQKVQEIYPELVTMDPEGNLGVAYDKLSIVALAAVDKLHSENLELKERLRKIEEKLGL